MTSASLTAAVAAHNHGIALAAAGDVRGAASSLRHAIALAGRDGVDPRTLKALWQAAIAGDDWQTGIAAGFAAAERDPYDAAFIQQVMLSLARCPQSALLGGDAFPALPLPEALPSLSVVLVSRDDARFNTVDAEYQRAFAHWPHERIRISDARSMYDGYARGFAQAQGEVVVFSHDDIRFAVPDFAARLARAMMDSDMVGVAGTTRVAGPALLWTGHPHLFGAITQKADGEPTYEFAVLSLRGPHIGGAQGLDGVFIAARRACIERIGFDTERYSHFHFYDVDFSYRAHLAGARVTIAGDLGLIHRSRGSYDEHWHAAQRAFADKFAFSYEAPGATRHWYAVPLASAAEVTRMYAKLIAAWNLDVL